MPSVYGPKLLHNKPLYSRGDFPILDSKSRQGLPGFSVSCGTGYRIKLMIFEMGKAVFLKHKGLFRKKILKIQKRPSSFLFLIRC